MRLALIIVFSLFSCQTIAEVKKFTLDNGFKILVKEDHRAPVAVSMIWYNVGSADEPGGITGVSHALEHLMFKGTTKFPQGVFSKTIAAIGGQENAFTNYDYTAYFEKVAASQLPVCLELEADRMQNLLLDKQEFAKEIKVVQEERHLRTENNPQSLLLERFLATAHLTEPYHHPVIGWMNDLQQLNIDDLQAWYQNFYAPNNALLVVVGDVQASKVRDLAALYFSPLKQRPSFKRKLQVEPPSVGTKSFAVHAPAQLPMLMFGYTVPSVVTAKNSWEPYALEVIAAILDAGESARFAKNLVRERHIASHADVYYNLYSRYQTQFIFSGFPAQGHSLSELKTALMQEIKNLQAKEVSSAELARIKTQLIAQKTFEKDSIFGQAMEIGLLETIGLGWQETENYINQVNNITPQQIQHAAKRYFQENSLTEGTLFPTPDSRTLR